jgi:processive 1,2-diacylglycerol beta-glucosyltransferase
MYNHIYGGDFMEKHLKVLILTGSYGNGHLQVTKSLQQMFLKKGVQDIVISDLFAEAHPLITNFTKYLYIKSYSFGQHVYGLFYYGSREMEHNKKITSWFNAFGMRKLKETIEKEEPDVIVNTFPMLVVPEFRKKTRKRIPSFNVLTDYSLHNRWMHAEIDKYYVATEDMKQEMIELGIQDTAIQVSGIPIHSSFERACSISTIYQKYALNPSKKMILIMAGAYGVLKDTQDIVQDLSEDGENQVVVVCGNNGTLRQRLEKMFAEQECVRILGYINEIHELMRIAAVMITKPGGITLSEAIALQVPLVLYRSVPGQERENARYFAKQGAAVKVQHIPELISQTKTILKNDELRMSLRQNMELMYQARAAQFICEDILQEIGYDSLTKFEKQTQFISS